MVAEELYKHIAEPQTPFTAAEANALAEMINDCPYFTAAHLLYIRALKDNNSLRFDSALKFAAIYAPSRQQLFDYVNTPVVQTTEQQDYFADLSDDLSDFNFAPAAPAYSLDDSDNAKPADDRNFTDWFDHIHDNEEQPVDQKSSNDDLIDNFLKQNEYKIPEKPAPVNDAAKREEDSDRENGDIMSVTLAEIYVKQQQYSRAINIFRKLSLRNPEKSAYFAARISQLEQLNNNQ